MFQRTSRWYQIWRMFERVWKRQKVRQKLSVVVPVKPNQKRLTSTHYPMLSWPNQWQSSITSTHLRTRPQSNENDERFLPWQQNQHRVKLLGNLLKRHLGLHHERLRREQGSLQGRKRIWTTQRQDRLQLWTRLTWKVRLRRLQGPNRLQGKLKRGRKRRKRSRRNPGRLLKGPRKLLAGKLQNHPESQRPNLQQSLPQFPMTIL